MRVLQRFRNCRSGSTAVEFAFVSLLMVIVSTAVVEFGRGLDVRTKLSYAADAAERKLLMDSSLSDVVLEAYVRAAYTGSDPDLLEVTISSEDIDGTNFRVVSLVYLFSPLVPNIVSEQINISVDRRMPLLTN